MKYRNACLLLLALICALSLLGCSAANEELDADPVVARYRDTEIRQSLVDYEKKNQSALSGGKEVHDRDAVDQLLLNRIMLDEAERLGLSVTQEEVDAEFAAQKKTTRSSRRCARISTNIASPPGSRWMATTPQFRISCRV